MAPLDIPMLPNPPRGWLGGPLILVRGDLHPTGQVRLVPYARKDRGTEQWLAHQVLQLERFYTVASFKPVDGTHLLKDQNSNWYVDRRLVDLAETSTGYPAGKWHLATVYTHLEKTTASSSFGLMDHQGTCRAIVGPHRGPAFGWGAGDDEQAHR